jgi:hypothetical protein
MEATVYDIDNKPIKCDKCDKPAGYIVQGESTMIALCSEHRPEIKWEGDLLKERPAMAPDFWTVDARSNCRQVVDSSKTTEDTEDIELKIEGSGFIYRPPSNSDKIYADICNLPCDKCGKRIGSNHSMYWHRVKYLHLCEKCALIVCNRIDRARRRILDKFMAEDK